MVQTRSKTKRPQVPGGSSSSTGDDGSQPAARPRGAKNPREAISPRQTTQASNMENDLLSERAINSSPSLTSSLSSLFESPSSSPHLYQVSSRSSTVSPQPGDVVQEAKATDPAPATGVNRARKRWTEEMNRFIWRTYLIATKLNTSKLYLDHLHYEFSLKYPQMQATRQRLGDQCRAIVRNRLLPQEVLEDIKNEVAAFLQRSQMDLETPTLTLPHNCSQQGQRRKWTTEFNEAIIRNYYKITELENNRSAYRRPLHQAVIAEHPELSEVSEQRISDQLRVILNNKMISDQRLHEIRDLVSNDLNLNSIRKENRLHTGPLSTTHTPLHDTIQEPNSCSPTLTPHLFESGLQPPTTEFHSDFSNLEPEKIKDYFRTALDKFQNADPTSRPYIPKQKTSRRQAQIVHFINTEILPQYITTDQDFITTHTIIYCAALTAAIFNGTKIRENDHSHDQNKRRMPPWQKRLQNKILGIRRDIARMTEYIRGNRTNRIIALVTEIKNKHRIHSQHEEPNTYDEHFVDTLKQKLNAASSRLKRYLNCTLRKTQNTKFLTNEKQFYRNLLSDTQRTRSTENASSNTPSADELHSFWSKIWSVPVSHNPDAEWLQADRNFIDSITPMEFEQIPIDIFMRVLNKTHNWKAPGSDRIHNFWYKKFTTIHPLLYTHINKFMQSPDVVPKFITQGLTYMIPKDADHHNPAKYRPITCLQTIYKLLTGCVAELIHQHTSKNNIISEEQKGCRKNSQGCKEQLVIDSVAMKQAIAMKTDINTMYIDYRKAFDSVPHSWLVFILQHYKVHPLIINFLKTSMQYWTTKLKTVGKTCLETPEIAIRRGIFQGDALSPLWFCLALNPLSTMLNSSAAGYGIIAPFKQVTLTHLMYMDDIKLYSDTPQSLHHLADITQTFSNQIHMEFGIDKCKTFSVKSGKISHNSYTLESGINIEPLEPNTFYKYLGFLQARQINQKEAKEELKKKFKHRLNILFRSQLNSRNLCKAINSYAIPVLTYSFGIINWTQNDLHNLQRIINTTLTAHRKHHPRSCVQRMTLPRDEGGRAIIDISNLHNKQITTLRQYFYSTSEHSSIHEIVTLVDKHHTPLNLIDRNQQRNERIIDKKEKITLWQQKSLHGRHRHDLQQPHVDKVMSNAWLRRGELFPETEAFMMAIQDQVIDTRNYQKYIIRSPNLPTDTCRHCHACPETIQHITSACRSLAQNDYKHRHDQVASIIHQHLAHKHNFIAKKSPYYKYKPDTILEDQSCKIYWDRTIITDKTIHYNRPDITVHDKTSKTVFLIDIAVPNSHNIQSTISEKLTKYQDLAIELKRQWRAETIHVVPIVISATGIIPRSLQRCLDILDIPKHTFNTLQKAVILNTCRLTRKFFTTSSISSSYTTTLA